MFTGIIEEIGVIKRISPLGTGKRLTISADRILDGLKVEDSVCVSGVCLTVVASDPSSFTAEAVGATLEKTTLGDYRSGRAVNLERALRLGDRMGGHMVQGHVNGIGKITKIQKYPDNWMMMIEMPGELRKYTVTEGSIAIDGISLTIAQISENAIGFSIIPYTFKHTTLSHVTVGDTCNIETDIIGKYVENLVPFQKIGKTEKKITINGLKKAGY